MVSTVATVIEPRQAPRTTTVRAPRQQAETKGRKPARSFLAALLRSLSAFVA